MFISSSHDAYAIIATVALLVAMVPETRTSLQALAIELTPEEVRSCG